MVPLNPITEDIFYVSEGETRNQRFIISAPVKNPTVWQLSKVETVPMIGIKKLTFAQDSWNAQTDYIDIDEQKDGDLFAMYADYYSSTVVPDVPEHDIVTENSIHCDVTCNSNNIKAGGSYKLVTAKFFDDEQNDVTDTYSELVTKDSWSCAIDDIDYTSSEYITWLEQDNKNQIKIKFANNRSFLTKVLIIKCTITDNEKEIVGEVHLEITAL